MSVDPEQDPLGNETLAETPLLAVQRILGGGPFAEIGRPRVVAASPTGELIAVGGQLGVAQWAGRDVAARPRPHDGWNPVGIYRAADLQCLRLITTRWPVNSIAFHPTLPLVAIGTGSYDGGYAFEGELLLLDLASGQLISALDENREVQRAVWADERRLDLVLSPRSDDHATALGSDAIGLTVERGDWGSTSQRMIHVVDDPDATRPQRSDPDEAAAHAELESRCLSLGVKWVPRRQVWAVEALADGRALAALDGVALECWAPETDELVWSLPAEGTGCQIVVAPDGRSAIVNVVPPRGQWPSWRHGPSRVEKVDLADGRPGSRAAVEFPAVVVSAQDHWAVRQVDHERQTGSTTVLLDAELKSTGGLALSGYDLFNHYFDIRGAPDLLFLQGDVDKPWLNKWVVAVARPAADAAPSVRRLFPLDWDPRGRHLYGGSGVYLDDAEGPALVHTGGVHDGAGLLRGNAFVARRVFPGGDLRWVFDADYQATAVIVVDNVIYVAFNSGELVALDARDGHVLGRQFLRAGGHQVVPLSLATDGHDRLIVGTRDGRILDCRLRRLRWETGRDDR